MTISFIAAASENNVIGNKGQLPWSLPDDLKFFKNTTWGFPIIMGRKTYDSFAKILKGRTNVVITRQADFTPSDAIVTKTIDEAIHQASTLQTKEIFIIGGGEIFTQALPLANRIYITRVHQSFEGDALFPDFSTDSSWEKVAEHYHEADAKHAVPFTFETWERK